jgi:hypothetical protein
MVVSASQSSMFLFLWIILIDIVLNVLSKCQFVGALNLGINTLMRFKRFPLAHLYTIHAHIFKQRKEYETNYDAHY